MTSFIAACGSGRSISVIPAVPAAWSVTTIAFMGFVSSVIYVGEPAAFVDDFICSVTEDWFVRFCLNGMSPHEPQFPNGIVSSVSFVSTTNTARSFADFVLLALALMTWRSPGSSEKLLAVFVVDTNETEL